MKKSLCDGPGCGKRMMDAPQARFGSKKGAGSCKCGGKCGPCKSKHAEGHDEEPDDDRDDNYGMSPSLTVNRPMPSIMTDAMDAHFYREDAPKCNPGNKPCGGRCIPQEQDCESTLRSKGKRRLIGGSALLTGAGVAGYGIKNTLPAVHADKPLQAALRKAGFSKTEQLKAMATTPTGRKALRLLGAASVAGGLGVGALATGANSYRKARKERQKRGDSVWASGFKNETSESF